MQKSIICSTLTTPILKKIQGSYLVLKKSGKCHQVLAIRADPAFPTTEEISYLLTALLEQGIQIDIYRLSQHNKQNPTKTLNKLFYSIWALSPSSPYVPEAIQLLSCGGHSFPKGLLLRRGDTMLSHCFAAFWVFPVCSQLPEYSCIFNFNNCCFNFKKAHIKCTWASQFSWATLSWETYFSEPKNIYVRTRRTRIIRLKFWNSQLQYWEFWSTSQGVSGWPYSRIYFGNLLEHFVSETVLQKQPHHAYWGQFCCSYCSSNQKCKTL